MVFTAMASEQLVLKGSNELSDLQCIIGCTAIIETVIEKTIPLHAASMEKTTEGISTQQKQLPKQNNKIKQLYSSITYKIAQATAIPPQ